MSKLQLLERSGGRVRLALEAQDPARIEGIVEALLERFAAAPQLVGDRLAEARLSSDALAHAYNHLLWLGGEALARSVFSPARLDDPSAAELARDIATDVRRSRPVQAAARARVEAVTGASLADARIAHDARTRALTARLSASALAVGPAIIAGEARSTDDILHHELAHVAQAGGKVGATLEVAAHDHAAESNARAVARAARAHAEGGPAVRVEPVPTLGLVGLVPDGEDGLGDERPPAASKAKRAELLGQLDEIAGGRREPDPADPLMQEIFGALEARDTRDAVAMASAGVHRARGAAEDEVLAAARKVGRALVEAQEFLAAPSEDAERVMQTGGVLRRSWQDPDLDLELLDAAWRASHRDESLTEAVERALPDAGGDYLRTARADARRTLDAVLAARLRIRKGDGYATVAEQRTLWTLEVRHIDPDALRAFPVKAPGPRGDVFKGLVAHLNALFNARVKCADLGIKLEETRAKYEGKTVTRRDATRMANWERTIEETQAQLPTLEANVDKAEAATVPRLHKALDKREADWKGLADRHQASITQKEAELAKRQAALEEARRELVEVEARLEEAGTSDRKDKRALAAAKRKVTRLRKAAENPQLRKNLAKSRAGKGRSDRALERVERARELANAGRLTKTYTVEARRVIFEELDERRVVDLRPVYPHFNVDHPTGYFSGGSETISDDARRGVLDHLLRHIKDPEARAREVEAMVGILNTWRANEGRADSLNTWDTKFVTVGSGIAAQGVFEHAIYVLRERDEPTFHQLFGRFGISVVRLNRNHHYMVLETRDGRRLERDAALAAIRDDDVLLAAIRAAGSNAQWQTALLIAKGNFSIAYARGVVLQVGGARIGWLKLVAGLPGKLRAGATGVFADFRHAGGGKKAEGLTAQAAGWLQAELDARELDPAAFDSWPADTRLEVAEVVARKVCLALPKGRQPAFAEQFGAEYFPVAAK